MSGIDLVNIARPPGWMAEAACAEVGGDEWFPDKGGSGRAAKRICARCPVVAQCLAYALEHGERFGVWGGLSEPERERLKKQRGPVVVPQQRATPPRVRDRVAEVRRLTGSGLSDRQVGERIGCTARTVLRLRARAGIPAAAPLAHHRKGSPR